MPSSPSLPAPWVDALFAKLAARYGAAWSRQYADVDPAAVKADWAETLAGLNADAIRGALAALPADRPPNAGQFRRLCVEAMPGAERQVFRALPAPPTPIPPGVRERMAAIKRSLTTMPAERRAASAVDARDVGWSPADIAARKERMAARVAAYAAERGIEL